jgi:putative transcriptional regulator
METLGGKLLIAGPSLWDPNFRRSVVLVGHHDEDGAVGVVLNRSADVSVHEAVPPLAELVEPGEPLFFGGPVEPTSVVVLAEFHDPSHAEVLAFGSVGFLPSELGDSSMVKRARVFAGYSGWGSGQLDAEMDEGSWITVDAVEQDVFHPRPEKLWEDVVRRLPPALATLRTMPADPSTN